MKGTLLERFSAKYEVDATTGCWKWVGSSNGRGYGEMRDKDGKRYAHRISYTLFKGDIPEGFVIDHLCRTPCCVNPAHLEAVSFRTNVIRGTGWAARHAAKTHCPHGHEYSAENTHITSRGFRQCRACWKRKWHLYRQK